jgi:hypothetical protein
MDEQSTQQRLQCPPQAYLAGKGNRENDGQQ